MKVVEQQIADCAKSIRLEHLDAGSQDERKRQEREAEKRRLAEAARSAPKPIT